MNNVECYKLLKHYFSVPYGGHIFAYTNKVTLDDIERYDFRESLSHRAALEGFSIIMSIFEEVDKFVGGIRDKKVLDVGSGIGWFIFLMAEAGADITMIEKITELTQVTECISKMKNLRLKINNCFIDEYLDNSRNTFDFALMLNVFDQLLRQDEAKAWKILGTVSEKNAMMFLMMGPTEQIPNVKGISTGTPVVASQVLTRDNRPDYEVILSRTNYKHYKTLLTRSFGDRELQVYW